MTNYNLPTRWFVWQNGVVRQRGEIFSLEELNCQNAVTAVHPNTGDTLTSQEEDPLASWNKLPKGPGQER